MEEKQFKVLVGKLDRIIGLLEAQNSKTDKLDKLVGPPKVGNGKPSADAKLMQGLDGFG